MYLGTPILPLLPPPPAPLQKNKKKEKQKNFFRGEWRHLHIRPCAFFRLLSVQYCGLSSVEEAYGGG